MAMLFDAAWLDRVAATVNVHRPILPINLEKKSYELLTCTALGFEGLTHLAVAVEAPDGKDRSADVAKAARYAVDAGLSDEQILGLLLNPANAVSAHCIEQPNSYRAAMRAIDLARGHRGTNDSRTKPIATVETNAANIIAKPFVWRDPVTIPQRVWLYDKQLMRGTISLIVAPGGAGKSSLVVGMALSMVMAAPLLEKWVPNKRQNVWLWQLEDSTDELARSIQAAVNHYGLSELQLSTGLFVNSALDGTGLCLATQTRDGAKILEPIAEAISEQIKANNIDVLIIDPFVSSHQASENDNGAIDAIAKRWARIAAETNCAILLVHHSRKNNGMDVDADSARGASALVNAARNVLTLNPMTENEATRLGIKKEERFRYFRTYNAKANRAPPASASDWYRLESVPLGNGDDVGVVVAWEAQTLDRHVSDELVAKAQTIIAKGNYRKDSQSPHWVGLKIARLLELDPKTHRSYINNLIDDWIDNGWLVAELAKDEQRKNKTFVRIGRTVGNGAPPLEGSATRGSAAAQSQAH